MSVRSDVITRLAEIVGGEHVVHGSALRQRASSYWDPSPLNALALVRPRDTEQVSAVLGLCYEAGQRVVVHGGLTGCVLGTVADATQLVISLERMRSIEEIDPVGRTMTVQAGAVLQAVQDAAESARLYFPLDLGARGSCTIGGNIATNAGGINVIRYGMMRELVLGLEVVLADGTVISSMNHMLKNNAGYDLKQLFIGSEGTLGIVTRAVLRLREAPLSHGTVMAALNSFDSVVGLLRLCERTLGGQLSAYEVMWHEYFHAVTEPGWHRAPLARNFPFYVIMEAEGADRNAETDRLTGVLEDAVNQGLVADVVMPKSQTERDALWAIREHFEAITEKQPTFLYDVSLPIKAMDEYINSVKADLQGRWPDSRCYVLGHIGDGNLHLFVDPGCGGANLHSEVDAVVYAPLLHIGGSISAEHGIGLEKKGWLARSRSESELALMRQVKRTLDPKNLLNPGMVFEL